MEENKNTNDIFQELPLDQRHQALVDNAYGAEEQIVTRPFKASQISEFKDKLSEDSVELSKIKAEYEEISKRFKAKMKPLEVSIKENTKNIRLGYEESLEEVYMLADQSEGIMTVYTKEGMFISSRRLNPSEKQMKFAHVGTGTHGE